MNCSQCSNPLTPNAKFCKNCGARQETPAAETAPIEKICGHCQAVCKPQAKFCPKCGTVFDAGAMATPAAAASPITPAVSAMAAVTAASDAPAASIARTEPPLIEPMDSAAAPPAAINAQVFPERHDSPPAFPQEPVPSSKSWIKWAVLALIVAAVAGGVLMANNMKALTGANSTPAASQAGKDSVSPEDKAKADALVGPQGGNAVAVPAAPLNDPSSVTIAPPPVINPAPAAPVINTGPELAPPPAAPAVAPNKPAPVKVQPAKKSGAPSLDDLLD
ncbi:MAG: zinc ribbon domain-containing protein [Comamonas sp.]